MGEFIANLKGMGWQVEPPTPDAEIPKHLLARYDNLPAELINFISSFSRCTNPSAQAWFVTACDLVRSEPFRFNEFELMSLSAAGPDQDWSAAVRAFWTRHFPLLLSVAGSYQYFALSLAGPTRGSVVYGAEPEFEECSIVAPSLTEFLAMFLAAQGSPTPAFPFSVAIPQNAA
ncbi:hypothetical protein [Lysobacter sp. M15]|uniref:hypothetical protein n=1 Tax=Lysobacter sp. M15 TaxID=2916837 RepID=UPI001F571A2A|nr:hypothetical protein [Lysobacter sp. M15]